MKQAAIELEQKLKEELGQKQEELQKLKEKQHHQLGELEKKQEETILTKEQ